MALFHFYLFECKTIGRAFYYDSGVAASLLVTEDAFLITVAFEQLSNRNTLGCTESDCDANGLDVFMGLDKGCGVFGCFS